MTHRYRFTDLTRRGLMAGVLAFSLATPARAYETTLTAAGADQDLTDMLRSASAVMNAKEAGLTSSQELVAAARSDYNTIVKVLYDQGYFGPVVNIRVDGREAGLIKPLEIPAKINTVAISVKPGPKFKFGTAKIDPVAPGTELPEDFQTGRFATTAILQQTAAASVEGWRNVGHAKAKLGGQKITANHLESRLNAHLMMAPGPKLRFGKVTFVGDTNVRQKSLHDIAGFPTGEVYDPEILQQIGTRLRRTGTFSSVSLKEAEHPNPDGTLDYTATLEDMPPRRFSFGAEMSSNTGLDLTLTWMHRNVLRRAAQFRFEANLRNIGGSEDIDGRIGVRLDQPDALGPDDSMFYLAEIERLNRTHYNVTRFMAGLGVKRRFSEDLYGELSLLFNYSDADDAFGDRRRFRYFYLPLRIERDKRDVAVNARRGTYLDFTGMPFFGVSGSASGLRLKMDGRGYVPLGDRLTLAGRVQVGSIMGADQRDVTPELLFFSGGAGTVRGQPYESLGIPIAPSGRIAGGRSYLGASVELRGKVTDKLSLVGFFDYGAIDEDSFVTASSATHSGAGLGVRYDLGGFGPLRLDLALPVSGTTDEGLQFYIGIGQAF